MLLDIVLLFSDFDTGALLFDNYLYVTYGTFGILCPVAPNGIQTKPLGIDEYGSRSRFAEYFITLLSAN